MTEQNQTTSSEKESAGSDLILDLNFVPQWARKPPDEVNYGRFKDGDSDHGRRGSSRGRSGGGYRDRGGNAGGRSNARRPARRDGGDNQRGGGSPAAGQQPKYRRPRSEQSAPHSGASRQPRFEREPVRMAPIRVRFLPEQSALSGLMRQVSSTKRAYPLIDLAGLLMSKPGCCFVKLEIDPAEKDAVLYQCKLCRTVSFERSEIESHIMSDHLEDYFDIEEVEGEPPTGKFVCVAKCGISGKLLGPPNHHSYAATVKRLHADRFSNMDFDAYKARIKTSHDPEDVERWKQEASKTVVYRLKESSEEEPKPMTRTEAERYMRDEIADKSIARTKKAAISEAAAHEIHDRSIKRSLRDEWQHESRFPLKLSFALRAAFKHKHMYVFKAGKGRGMNFVTAVQPVPLDPEHAIPSIHDVLTYLRENPGCTKKQMAEALRPDCELDSDEVKELLQPLHWLVDRGHIIEFFNGTLSVPLIKSNKPKPDVKPSEATGSEKADK